MVPTLETYLKVLRAVDRGGHESRTTRAWSFTTTSEIAGSCGMSRQQVTPLLRNLESEGFVTRTEQSDSSVTWHLCDPSMKLLRAYAEVEIDRGDDALQRP
jgi:DNA-binding MarR family transcriptional regulator